MKKEKKEFAPDFTFILFEEPEAFLHPNQQEILNLSLNEVASGENQQVLIVTHSPNFVSKNVDDLTSLLKLTKKGAMTLIYQINGEALSDLYKENKELKEILSEEITEVDKQLESIRYCLWLDPDRCCTFFANTVLICEGLSEKVLIDYLIKTRNISFRDKKVYMLNAGGKYDIHRYMNLFNKLGIRHAVLYDGDNNKLRHEKINKFIEKNKNEFTLAIHQFEGDLEDFLEIEKPSDNYKKPLNVMWCCRNGNIKEEKLDELISIANSLIG